MLNREVSWHLKTISVLLELSGANTYKVRAYRNAARSVKRLNRSISLMLKDGSISGIQGIGPRILGVIEELVETGESSLLVQLRDQVSPALVELGSIPGTGAKTALKLVRELGVQNIAELEAAAEAGRVRQIPGFGIKKEEAVLSGIKMLRSRGSLVPIGISRPVAENVLRLLHHCDGVVDAQIAGSVRRWQDLNANVDLVASVLDIPKLIAFLNQVRGIQVSEVDSQKIMVSTSMDFVIRIWLVDPGKFALGLLSYTGSKEHIQALSRRGMLSGHDEEELYASLGLHLIPPEARRPDLVLTDYLLSKPPPPLVEETDIRGDLHLHSQWSDGVLDIAALAGLAAERGYEYIAITDHSPSLAIARGLTPDRLEHQVKLIRGLKDSLPLEVLAGIEVDIKTDGSLDLPDSILAQLDWVVASVHSNLGMRKEAMTERILAAMANPFVKVLGHPTGRILQRRPGYELDWERIFAAARDYNVALELNSSPDRLDIKDELVIPACAQGVKIAINTDAHSSGELDNMRFGVATARRGGARKSDVLNCLSLEELQHHFRK